MKNKHLVFLFLAVVALGLVVRQLPLRYRSFFQTPLFRMDSGALTKIVLTAPGRPELTIEQTDYQWVAEQAGRTTSVPDGEVRRRLQALAGIRAFETLKTKRPDTLGFDAATALRLRLFRGDALVEQLEIGKETEAMGTTCTYLRLPGHAGLYKAAGAFRTLFHVQLNDFRPADVARFDPDSIRRFGIHRSDSTPVFFTQIPDSGRWRAADGSCEVPADSVRTWLRLFAQLENSPFADNFDESREKETLQTAVYLESAGGGYWSIRFYAPRPPDAPEDISGLRAQGMRALPPYVVHSSRNLRNYFAVSDTTLVLRIFNGILPARRPQ